MKLNVDCIRDILLFLESLDYEQTTNLEKIHQTLSEYSINEISYTCLKLKEAELINADSISAAGHTLPQIYRIYDITYLGHQFLENIYSDSNWHKVKDIASKIGTYSLSALTQIASTVVSNLISNHL